MVLFAVWIVKFLSNYKNQEGGKTVERAVILFRGSGVALH